MADLPETTLVFDGGCPDCGHREVALPPALPDVGDDFDWDVRDFDSLRRFMMEELAARFPERARWTPADLEVVLVEIFAYVLDQLSDTLDRVSAEAFLSTARRPESVRRLLKLIDHDAVELARDARLPPFDAPPVASDTRTDEERFDQRWLDNPAEMDAARQAGPRAIHDQRRMVTLGDHAATLEEHPLVLRAHAYEKWEGSWTTIHVAVIGHDRVKLDETGVTYPDDVWAEVEAFHRARDVRLLDRGSRPTLRSLLSFFVDDHRMCGREVVLEDAVEAGIQMALSIQVNVDYFQSEVRRAVESALGTGPGGYFEPATMDFGRDLYAGDLYATLMALDGVDNVCLNRFKRLGDRYPDRSEEGWIVFDGLEIAVCDNDRSQLDRGYFTLSFTGGRKG